MLLSPALGIATEIAACSRLAPTLHQTLLHRTLLHQALHQALLHPTPSQRNSPELNQPILWLPSNAVTRTLPPALCLCTQAFTQIEQCARTQAGQSVPSARFGRKRGRPNDPDNVKILFYPSDVSEWGNPRGSGRNEVVNKDRPHAGKGSQHGGQECLARLLGARRLLPACAVLVTFG